MKDVRNISKKPLRVPLPKGGVLHLGPLQTGQVAANALEHPPFKKMVEAGEIEVVGEGEHQHEHAFAKAKATVETHGRGGGKTAIPPSGDR